MPQRITLVDNNNNPITAANPLSIGLAVDTLDAQVTNDGTFAKETGGNLATLVTNTTGLATASNQSTANTSLASVATNTSNTSAAAGAKGDSAATDSTSSWSPVSLLKGLYALLAGTLTVKRVISTSGGSTPYHLISAASDNATNVKNGAGQVYDASFSNAASSARYVKFYDKATAPASTDTPKRTLQVPANATLILTFPVGLAFASGIGFRTTTGIADNDVGSVGASDLSIDLGYA